MVAGLGGVVTDDGLAVDSLAPGSNCAISAAVTGLPCRSCATVDPAKLKANGIVPRSVLAL